MFKSDIFENNNQKYLSVYNNKDCQAKICLSWGASLQQLRLGQDTIINNLIEEDEQFRFLNSSCSAILFPFANRIDNGRFSYKGNQFQLNCNEKKRAHALHGLVFDKTFSIDNIELDKDKATVVLSFEHQSSPGFPFPFAKKLRYRFQNNACQLQVETTNTGSQTFPFSLGWHPYFYSPNLQKSKLKIATTHRVATREDMIPTHLENHQLPTPLHLQSAQFDTGFALQHPQIEYQTPTHHIQLTTDSPLDQHYAQLYTPAHGKSIAIEPMTAIADCFNNGIGTQELSPQQSFALTWHIHKKTNKPT